jgi:hypothetical protein
MTRAAPNSTLLANVVGPYGWYIDAWPIRREGDTFFIDNNRPIPKEGAKGP